MVQCSYCNEAKAALRRPKTGDMICKPCFFFRFEEEIHDTIVRNKLFRRGEKLCIAASGGKDSTVLAHVITTLNQRHDYGLDLFLLSIDEGITGYRDDSLETVKQNQRDYQIPLKIVSYQDLYGWTMDRIVQQIGLKNNCTFCGVFRRQALDRGAFLMQADKIVTGHNADDIAESVLLNFLRGDIARLGRCVSIITGEDGPLPRCKPFKYTYEKEIVMYAYYKKLVYFSTECIYAPNAYRGHAREFLKNIEACKPQTIINIIRSAEYFHIDSAHQTQVLGTCTECGYMSSQAVCKACVLLDGLRKGTAKMAVGSDRQRRRAKEANEAAMAKIQANNANSQISDISSSLSLSAAAAASSSSSAAFDSSSQADAHASFSELAQALQASISSASSSSPVNSELQSKSSSCESSECKCASLPSTSSDDAS